MTEPGGPAADQAIEPEYVAARSVLIDALQALKDHSSALIVIGAQAIYLQTGRADIAVAPYTTDGDLGLDPNLLSDSPELGAAMTEAGFRLLEAVPGRSEPGTWFATVTINGRDLDIPVDIIVPEGVAPAGGRRGARLGLHGNRAARTASGLEAALVDNAWLTIASLDARDSRRIRAKVAGPAALLVAKMYKIHDRMSAGRRDRVVDKDALDVFRIMQTTLPVKIASTINMLAEHGTAGPPTLIAMDYLVEIFGKKEGAGVEMAVRSLRLALPKARVAEICVSYTKAVMDSIGGRPTG